jgi:hypothetical protein
VRTAAFSAVGEGGSSPIVTVDAADNPGVSQFKGTEIAQPDRPELTSARTIISGGHSLGSEELHDLYGEHEGLWGSSAALAFVRIDERVAISRGRALKTPFISDGPSDPYAPLPSRSSRFASATRLHRVFTASTPWRNGELWPTLLLESVRRPNRPYVRLAAVNMTTPVWFMRSAKPSDWPKMSLELVPKSGSGGEGFIRSPDRRC